MKKEEALKRLEVIETEVNELKKIINLDENSKNVEMSEFLFDIINDSTMKISENYITFFKKNEWILQQDFKNERLWVKYNTIWLVFETRFSLSYVEIQAFIGSWIETNLNWKSLTPLITGPVSYYR